MEWPKCEEPGCINGQTEHRMGGWQECPACNGTGERELTVDEADKYLRFNKCRWWPLYECPDDVVIEVELYKFTGTVSHERLGNYAGYNLTEALRAAARAVRRQG